jgi:hypothetical protein
MLSIEKCRKILNKNGQEYSDAEIFSIQQILQDWLEIDYFNKQLKSKKKNEEGSHHVKGFKRRAS